MDATPDARLAQLPPAGLPTADALLDTLPWGMLVLDEQRVVRQANRQAARWCGLAPEALLGQPLAGAALPAAVRAALLPGPALAEATPHEVYLPDLGQWVSLTARRQPGGWVVYGQDITPQKQHEQQYQALADHTPDLLTRWGPDLRLRYANAALVARLGAPLPTLLGKTTREMGLPAAVADLYMAALQQVFDTGQPQEHYHALPTPQGLLTYHSRLVPELRDGRLETVLGIARDITGLQHNQAEALRQRDELTQQATDSYQALFDSLDQGFCVLEVLFDEAGQQAIDYRYLKVNPVFAQQSGMPAEAVGRTIRELMPDLDPFWFDTFGQVARLGATVRTERQVPQLGRWFDVHAFPLGPPAARQVAVLFTDISARKQAEEQLRRGVEVEAFRRRLADALAPLTDPVAVQQAVAHLARLHFGADHCYYGEIESGQVISRHDAAADGLPPVPGTYPLADLALLQAASDTGRPLRVRDVRYDAAVDDRLRRLCERLDVIACLRVPVLRHGQVVGELCLGQRTPRNWADADEALAAEVAERTCAAVERARTEQALRESEEKYRAIFTSITEGFSLLDVQFDAHGEACDVIVRDANPAQERIDGVRAVVGRRVRDILPDVEPKWLHRYAQVARSGEPAHFEDWSAATRRWYEVAASRVGEAGSTLVAIVYSDITERKQAEAHMAFLAEVSRDLVEFTTSEEIITRLGPKIGQFFNTTQCLFAEYADQFTTSLAYLGWHAPDVPDLRGTYRLRDFMSAEAVELLLTGQPLVVADTQVDARVEAGRYGQLGIRSFVAMSLVRNGEWRFQLSVLHREPRHWAASEVELLRELAARIWTRLERARAEAALELSEQRLRTLTANLPEAAVFIVDGALRYEEAQGEALLEAGLRPADLLGRPVAEALPPGLAAHHLPYYRQALAGQSFTIEHTEFGHTYLSRGVPLLDEAGRPEKVLVMSHDITDRKRAEEALRASEERFRLFVTASAAALYRMDADWGQMQQLNSKGFLADTEAPSAAWLAAYIPPADQAIVRAAIEAAIAGRHFFELEHRVFRADGSVGWTFSRAVPVLNEQGELVEWFGTATDITARKQAEEAVQQSAQQRALFEATQAAQEAERRRMAESLHNGIGQLLYAIKLRLEQSRTLVPAPTTTAQALRQETDALLSDAIRQTRALSHELVPLVLEEFGLAAALQDIGRKLTTPPLVLRSHVALDAAAAPLSSPLQMALYRIGQELALNVVRHARGATEASLELETMPGWVLLRVEDNGPGFAATPAAGLGLRSIRDRVALLGGQLQSGNLPTGGAYVRIRLPLPALPAHDTPLPG